MAAKKAPKKAATPKKSAKAKGEAAPKTEAKGEKGISSLAVNRGHLFTLRPRVSTAFRPEDFLAAKRALAEEKFESIEKAARAVAERALALSNDPKAREESSKLSR
jgi:hypothetical protein